MRRVRGGRAEEAVSARLGGEGRRGTGMGAGLRGRVAEDHRPLILNSDDGVTLPGATCPTAKALLLLAATASLANSSASTNLARAAKPSAAWQPSPNLRVTRAASSRRPPSRDPGTPRR